MYALLDHDWCSEYTCVRRYGNVMQCFERKKPLWSLLDTPVDVIWTCGYVTRSHRIQRDRYMGKKRETAEKAEDHVSQ